MPMLYKTLTAILNYICAAALALSVAAPVQAREENHDANRSKNETDYVNQIEAQFSIYSEQATTERINSIKTKLLSVIPKARTDKREIVIKVLDAPVVNAFALPDGHIYIFKGLVDECETDDMLAGVVAHELTHIFHRHHSRMDERQIRGLLIGLLTMIASGDTGGIIFGQMLAASMVDTYGRAAEIDADRSGVNYLVDAGYDPVSYIELLQILEQESIHQPQPGGNYFTIHPYPDERMTIIRKTLAERGIIIPETVYRVHLQLKLHLPLSETEKKLLVQWENQNSSSDGKSGEDGKNETPPAFFLSEFKLRRALFQDLVIDPGIASGVITVGDTPIFYLAEDSASKLYTRSQNLISNLGELFLMGLRNFEIQDGILDNQPVLIARRRIIAATTAMDAQLLNKDALEVNSERVNKLKEILWKYYVSRRI